jgi:single-strand DNA-binding protein
MRPVSTRGFTFEEIHMGIHAKLIGNILAAPTMKTVTVRSEDRRIAELRVMSAFYRRTDDGLEQVDDKTFPVDVTIWSEKLADMVLKHIKTGASVVIEGDLFVAPWIGNNNEPQSGVRIDAESLSLNLNRVDEVVYRARQPRENEERAGQRDPLDV